MVSFVLTSFTRLFAFYVAIFYSIADLESVLASQFPSIVGAVYKQATQNSGVTLLLLILLFFIQFIGSFGYISASIRLLYGFGRNGSFSHGKWWSKIDTKHNLPTNVLYIVTFANFVLGFVYLASELGFQILLGSANGLYCEYSAEILH